MSYLWRQLDHPLCGWPVVNPTKNTEEWKPQPKHLSVSVGHALVETGLRDPSQQLHDAWKAWARHLLR